MPEHASDAESRQFAAAFRSFLTWVQAAERAEPNQVAALVAGFLGAEGAAHSVVSRELPVFEHVNLQAAVDAWSAAEGRAVEVHGIALPQHHGLSLQEIVGT